MKNFSDLAGYNGIMCKHVYEYMGAGPCGYCGFNTHDPNWNEINKLYAEYKKDKGFFFNNTTWWSI